MGKAGKTKEPDYREMLLQRKREVLASLGAAPSVVAAGRMSEEDQAQHSNEEFVSVRLNHLDYQQLKLVDEALDRMAAGDYGICLGCDESIPAKRLHAIPWARYCVQCQEQSSLAPADDGGGEVIGQLAWR